MPKKNIILSHFFSEYLIINPGTGAEPVRKESAVSKFVIDGEEFESDGRTCPKCQGPKFMVDLKSLFISSPIAEKLEVSVHLIKECLRCNVSLSCN